LTLLPPPANFQKKLSSPKTWEDPDAIAIVRRIDMFRQFPACCNRRRHPAFRRVEKSPYGLVNVEFDKVENVKDPVKARMGP
jgi:hypothetical protein